MIVDCVTFNDEFDLLDLRLQLLSPVVNWFVLVESDTTFSGEPKPLHYWVGRNFEIEQRHRDRIIHVAVRDMPETDDPWQREAHQRNAILRGLAELRLTDDDVILVSDVDEIPNPAQVDFVARSFRSGILRDRHASVAFDQTLYMYNLQWRHKRPWYGTRAILYRDLGYPQDLRSTLGPKGNELVVPNGGWSFSSFGGVDAVRRKVAAFSHQEVNTPEYTDPEHVAACIEQGHGLMPGQDKWTWIATDDDWNELPDVLKIRSRWPAVWYGDSDHASE